MSEAPNTPTDSMLPRMAICYDFDKTLSPDDMQAFTLIPSFGIDKEKFWSESNVLAQDNLMDTNLAWMYQLIRYSKFLGKSLKREYFNAIGNDVTLYQGVESWFQRLNVYAQQQGIQLEHYIISSGLKEIIEGSPIAGNFTRIYASSYLYNPDGIAVWPTQAINYTNKTQYIFRIAKGVFEEYDERVNASTADEQLYVPYENIVYVGDSATDIPCMRLVKSRGGYAIGVYDPQKNNLQKVYQLLNDGRINFYAPADYSENSPIEIFVKQIIDEVTARESIKRERKPQREQAENYRRYREVKDILSTLPPHSSTKKKLNEILKQLRDNIQGNID